MARPFPVVPMVATAPSKPAKRKLFDATTAVLLALVAVGAVVVYRREGMAGVIKIAVDDSMLFLDILPKVLAGCLIGAFIGLLAPREAVARWVGSDSGLRGLAVATVIGIVLPGGPFTIYPLAGTFLMIGAGIGPVVAFVTAWTLLGFNRAVVWEIPFFGADFVLWRSLVTLPLPAIAGLFAQALMRALKRRPT